MLSKSIEVIFLSNNTWFSMASKDFGHSQLHKRNFLRIAILLIILFLGLVVALRQQYIYHPRQEDHLILADAQQPVFALVYIAQAKGYFQKQGLEISYRKFFTGKDALNDVIAGNSDLATVFETPVVTKIYQGNDLRILTTLHKSTQNTGLIGLSSHQIKQASDLKTKKIAVPLGTNAEFFLYTLLIGEGIKPSDVNLVDTPFERINETLKSGQVDAAATFSTTATIREFTPSEINLIYSDLYTEMSVLVGNQTYISANLTTLTKFIKALFEAKKFYRDHPEAAYAIIHQRLPWISANDIELISKNSQLTLKLDNALLTILRREANFLHSSGEYSQPVPDYSKFIEPLPLKQVDQFSVTLL
jgi:NitT/TauT family transport system substrate-binding protein